MKLISHSFLFTACIAVANVGRKVAAFSTPLHAPKCLSQPLMSHPHGNFGCEDDSCKRVANDVFLSRRNTLTKVLGGGTAAVAAAFFTGGLVSDPDMALAFDNKISNKWDDRPKQRGAKPKGLGVASRKDMVGEEYMGLKQCGAAPNCFCSTDPIDDDPDHNIPSWKWPTRKLASRQDAFQQLYEVVKAYPPGQSNIDGGGFNIVTFDSKAGYMYVQFESLKNGFIDDVEFAVIDGVGGENSVQVRSSSRLGYLDYGVNAKRLNYLANSLREKGWDAPGVDFATHMGYAEENGLKV